MSKSSHAKHEHKVAEANHSQDSMPDEDFSKHHKLMIWVVAIIMVIALPILFAALTLLRIISW